MQKYETLTSVPSLNMTIRLFSRLLRTSTIVIFLLLSSQVATAATLPDGKFLLSSPNISTETGLSTHRYIELLIEDDVVNARFVSTFFSDPKECQKTGRCSHDATPLKFGTKLQNGAIVVENWEHDISKIVGDPAPAGMPQPKWDMATVLVPLLDAFSGASIEYSENGFSLITQDRTTTFLRSKEGDIERILAWYDHIKNEVRYPPGGPGAFNGCEVSGLLRVFHNPNPSDGDQKFANSINGLALYRSHRLERHEKISELQKSDPTAVRRLAPPFGDLVMHSIRTLARESRLQDPSLSSKEVEVRILSRDMGSYRDVFSSYLIQFQPYLSDLVALYQHSLVFSELTGEDIASALCNDPTMGMAAPSSQ